MSVVRVVVTRTGGFAGVTRQAEEDDPGRAERLSDAVRASAGSAADGRARDVFVYEFALVTTTATERIDLGESAMDATLRRAVRALFAP